MLTRYEFQCFRYGSRETFATQIEVGKLDPVDAGANILIGGRVGGDSIVWEVLTGSRGRRWGRLEAVQHKTVDPNPQTALCVDGVWHELADDLLVWLGWHPSGPPHLQRTGFER